LQKVPFKRLILIPIQHFFITICMLDVPDRIPDSFGKLRIFFSKGLGNQQIIDLFTERWMKFDDIG
jgi:hypothetical protein